MTEAEMFGWHHRLSGREFERAPGVSKGQGGLECCCPWGPSESDTTLQLNTNIVPSMSWGTGTVGGLTLLDQKLKL